MKNFVSTVFLLCILVVAGSASATVLTFDDIDLGGNTYVAINDGYGGLDWDNFGAINATYGAYDNARVSGDQVAFNWAAQVGTVNDSVFDFNGAYLTGAWNDGLNIDVTGYRDGAAVYSTTVTVDTNGPTWFTFNYMDIDSLTFYSYGGTLNSAFTGEGFGDHFAMDNFTFNEPVDNAPVPEPTTMILLGTGLLGLAGFNRKKK